MRRIYTLLIVWTLLEGLGTAPALAQNARSMAMAGAYGALARGVESVAWNPANLGLMLSPGFSMEFPSIWVHLGNSSFGLSDYNRYNGAFLSEGDKQALLEKIPEQGFTLNMLSNANAIGFSISRFAFSARVRAASDISIAKDIFDLLLNGNEFGRRYDFSETDGGAWAYLDLAASYAQPIYLEYFHDFSIGMTFHWLRGLGFAEVLSAEGTLTTDLNGAYGNGNADFRVARAGNGISFDLGAAAIKNNYTIGVVLKNLFGRIGWNQDITLYSIGILSDTLTVERLSNEDPDSLITDFSEEKPGDPFTVSLPLQLQVSGAMELSAFRLSLQWTQAFQRAPGISTSPAVAFGAEYYGIGFLPLRLGFAVGGAQKFVTAMGLGLRLGTFSLNMAVQSGRALVPGMGTGIGLSVDMNIGL